MSLLNMVLDYGSCVIQQLEAVTNMNLPVESRSISNA